MTILTFASPIIMHMPHNGFCIQLLFFVKQIYESMKGSEILKKGLLVSRYHWD